MAQRNKVDDRDVRDQLRRAGYTRTRATGGHEIWSKPGLPPVALTIHGRRDKRSYINTKTVRRALNLARRSA